MTCEGAGPGEPRLVRAAALPRVPWRGGGGGTTRPVAGDDDGGWRLSIASIDRTGPFSDFRGHRRVLTVASGHLELQVRGAAHALGPGDSLAFDGGDPVRAVPVEGPVVVVNAMAASPGSPRVRVVELRDDDRAGGPGGGDGAAVCAAVVLSGDAQLNDHRGVTLHRLGPLDSLVGRSQLDRWEGDARVLVVEGWT